MGGPGRQPFSVNEQLSLCHSFICSSICLRHIIVLHLRKAFQYFSFHRRWHLAAFIIPLHSLNGSRFTCTADYPDNVPLGKHYSYSQVKHQTDYLGSLFCLCPASLAASIPHQTLSYENIRLLSRTRNNNMADEQKREHCTNGSLSSRHAVLHRRRVLPCRTTGQCGSQARQANRTAWVTSQTTEPDSMGHEPDSRTGQHGSRTRHRTGQHGSRARQPNRTA